MGALEKARAHLAKARQFLDAAELKLDADLYDAAASAAVSAGINAKDAICLRLVGQTTKGENHKRAAGELARAGQAGKELELTFARLLGLKTTAQYQAASIARGEAVKVVEWAARMVDGAGRVISS